MCCFVCQEFFCFILEIFPKSCCPLSNHVLSSGQLDYNTTRILFCQPFFNTFFTCIWTAAVKFHPSVTFSLTKIMVFKVKFIFQPTTYQFFLLSFTLVRFFRLNQAFLMPNWSSCSISGWYTFLQPLTSLTERGIKCTIFPLHHPIKIRVSKGGFQFWVCQIAQNRTCFVPLSENKKN